MVKSTADTVESYLAALPPARREVIEAVRACLRSNLDSDYGEVMQYGMISYVIPHRVFPPGYHCDPTQPVPFAALAAQKNHVSLYLMGLYVGSSGPDETDESTWFRQAWTASGKPLPDMGKSCIRFKTLDELALDVIAEAIRRMPAARFIERYRQGLPKK